MGFFFFISFSLIQLVMSQEESFSELNLRTTSTLEAPELREFFGIQPETPESEKREIFDEVTLGKRNSPLQKATTEPPPKKQKIYERSEISVPDEYDFIVYLWKASKVLENDFWTLVVSTPYEGNELPEKHPKFDLFTKEREGRFQTKTPIF